MEPGGREHRVGVSGQVDLLLLDAAGGEDQRRKRQRPMMGHGERRGGLMVAVNLWSLTLAPLGRRRTPPAGPRQRLLLVGHGRSFPPDAISAAEVQGDGEWTNGDGCGGESIHGHWREAGKGIWKKLKRKKVEASNLFAVSSTLANRIWIGFVGHRCPQIAFFWLVSGRHFVDDGTATVEATTTIGSADGKGERRRG
jgi:hypothetical protein